MTAPKTERWIDVMKRAFPPRRVTAEDAAAMREGLQRLQERAAAAGWTPEYVASLNAEESPK